MYKTIRIILMPVWFVALILMQSGVFAQRPDSRVPGTSRSYFPSDPDQYNFEHRHFSASRLDELRSRKEFQYDEKMVQEEIRKEQEKENNRKLKERTGRNNRSNSSENDRSPQQIGSFGSTAGWIWVLIIFAVIVILLMVFLGFKPSSFFRRNSKNVPEENAASLEEDINRMPLESELEKAIRLKNFKLAVRILYLGVLKQLNDLQWIDWKQHKTNWDYVRELKNSSIRPGFRDITNAFDYVWYGNFEIDEATFQLIRDKINLFRNSIATR
jgi:hypothetical protein